MTQKIYEISIRAFYTDGDGIDVAPRVSLVKTARVIAEHFPELAPLVTASDEAISKMLPADVASVLRPMTEKEVLAYREDE